MKKHLFYSGLIISTLLFSEACKNKAAAETAEGNAQEMPVTATADVQTPAANPNAPTMQFAATQYDFGSIKEKDVVKHTFAFTNTGKSPLTIENAYGSCGCTVPTWPKTPIKPGETGEIKVEFNSAGKSGPQSKTVTIVANTEPRETVLTLVGTVNMESAAPAH